MEVWLTKARFQPNSDFAGNLVGSLGSTLAAIGFLYAAYVSL
jgi:hypothetical protein